MALHKKQSLFKIEDEIHAEIIEKEFDSFSDALEELKKISTIPWHETPNRCPCANWESCEREYHILEYDDSIIPWKEIQRKEVLIISAKGIKWQIPQ